MFLQVRTLQHVGAGHARCLTRGHPNHALEAPGDVVHARPAKQHLVSPKSATGKHRARNPHILVAEARAAELRRDSQAAIERFDEALEVLGVSSPQPLLADVMRWKVTVLRELGDTRRAALLYEMSVDVARQMKYAVAEAHELNCLGIIAQRRGDLAAAEALYADAAAIAEAIGEQQPALTSSARATLVSLYPRRARTAVAPPRRHDGRCAGE